MKLYYKLHQNSSILFKILREKNYKKEDWHYAAKDKKELTEYKYIGEFNTEDEMENLCKKILDLPVQEMNGYRREK